LLPCLLIFPIISILLIKGLSLSESIHAFEVVLQGNALAIREIQPSKSQLNLSPNRLDFTF
jgi:hypothetical protein